VVGNAAVMFAVNLGQAFSGLTYSVPSTVNSHYVTGLTPGAGYTIGTSSVGGSVTVTITAGGSATADNAGVLHF